MKKTIETARESVKELGLLLKFGEVGTVAGDVESIVRFMTKALNNAGEADIATLARLAAALKGDK